MYLIWRAAAGFFTTLETLVGLVKLGRLVLRLTIKPIETHSRPDSTQGPLSIGAWFGSADSFTDRYLFMWAFLITMWMTSSTLQCQAWPRSLCGVTISRWTVLSCCEIRLLPAPFNPFIFRKAIMSQWSKPVRQGPRWLGPLYMGGLWGFLLLSWVRFSQNLLVSRVSCRISPFGGELKDFGGGGSSLGVGGSGWIKIKSVKIFFGGE